MSRQLFGRVVQTVANDNPNLGTVLAAPRRRRREGAGLCVAPARLRLARLLLIGLSFLIASFTAHHVAASEATPTPQSDAQAQAVAPAGQSSVLEAPRNSSRRKVDREQSRRITDFLHSQRLSSVSAQVFVDEKGARTAVLTGQLAYQAVKDQAEQQVRDFLRGSPIAIQNRISVSGGLTPPRMASQNELELPQIGRLSARFLGCWQGTTAERPLAWQALSPSASNFGYHSDRIRLCVTVQGGALHVIDASAKREGARYTRAASVDYWFSYKPLSATGAQILMEVKSGDPTMPNYVVKGSARCTLNADDTVTYFISATTSINGQAAVRTETVALLGRER
ncbi:MAG TPA: hypothetical protein VEC38_11650 [Candidatus Binataceae bacterium]|nr:hypothetical protein [Candidatus Binataceae bacterium]